MSNRIALTVETVAKATKDRSQAVKILEEAAEVFEARDMFENGEQKDPRVFADEIADLIIAACGLAEAWGLDLTSALARKALENERRGY